MKTLLGLMNDWRFKNAMKHELDEDYVIDSINKMSNYEFLQEVSSALEEMMMEQVSVGNQGNENG